MTKFKVHFFTSQILILVFALIFSLLSEDVFSQSRAEARREKNKDNTSIDDIKPDKPPKTNPWVGNLENSKQREILENGEVAKVFIEDGDTLYVFEMEEILIFAPRIFKNRYERARYNRLVRNVKRVYPYAKIAGQKYREYNELLLNEPNERKRNVLMKEAEKDLRESFEGDLRRLTFSQGFVLVKLVDRETQNTTYDVLKEFRGVFSAVFWQGLGRLFGYNLKSQYDPHGEDKLIEEIIVMIEAGAI